MKLRILLALSVAVLAATAASAQPPRSAPPAAAAPLPAGVPSPAERFKAADTNGDGKVDRQEFLNTLIPDAKPFIEAIWKDRDTNKDGWLSQEELTTNGPPPRPPPRGDVTAALPPG